MPSFTIFYIKDNRLNQSVLNFSNLDFNEYIINELEENTYRLFVKTNSYTDLSERIISQIVPLDSMSVMEAIRTINEIECIKLGRVNFNKDYCTGRIEKTFFQKNPCSTIYSLHIDGLHEEINEYLAFGGNDITKTANIGFIRLLNYIRTKDFLISTEYEFIEFSILLNELFNRKNNFDKNYTNFPINNHNKHIIKKSNRKVFLFD